MRSSSAAQQQQQQQQQQRKPSSNQTTAPSTHANAHTPVFLGVHPIQQRSGTKCHCMLSWVTPA
jgi:hypothetical protein